MDNCVYEYLRPMKGEFLKKWHDKGLDTDRKLVSYNYDQATILPLTNMKEFIGCGGVVDKNGEYIEASSIEFINKGYDCDNITYIDKKVCYCGFLFNQWGHFLMESVARLWYFLENGNDDIESYVFFVSLNGSTEIKGNYKSFFELLGISEKISIINIPTKYREVIIPELGFKKDEYFSKQLLNVYDKIVNNALLNCSNIESYKKIYFTRTQFKKASINEYGLEMLDNFFSKNGFKIIAPETLSLEEMIYIIRHSDVVASLSGSVCHNMIFAQNGQKLIQIERTVLNNNYQSGINIAKELNVIPIDANIHVYPVEIGFGPFIIAFNEYLERFAKDFNYSFPDEKFYTKKFFKRCFRKYMKQYNTNYKFRWVMDEWMVAHTSYMREAYLDSLKIFGKYIYGDKPFRKSHFFQIHYIKRAVVRVLKKGLKK